MRVSEIRVNQIRVNQGLGVFLNYFYQRILVSLGGPKKSPLGN